MDVLSEPQIEPKTLEASKFFENVRGEIVDKLCVELGLVQVDEDGEYVHSHYSLLFPIREALSTLPPNIELPELVRNYRIELGLVSLDEDFEYKESIISKLFDLKEILGLETIDENLGG